MRRIKTLLPMMHGIVICFILLGSITWAFFSEIVSNGGNTIQTAVYDVRIEVSGSDAGFTPLTEEGVLLEEGKAYDIRITAEGDATQGYCIVSAGDLIVHTVRMAPEEVIEFSIYLPGTESRYVEFIPNWGEYRVEISAGDEIRDGFVVSQGDVVGDDVSDGNAQ